MDLNSLKNAVSNLTLYDVKAGVRSLQNAVMNYTEMEAKVREATNNEPWGASSTMQQEIANATFNYQLLNEIMPMIYHRFTEKTAEQWRQIYKALQLLEFLIKNGSERVIDDARSHLSLLKMLKQFHFIDANGKDQGINVRNRSKELTELLSDVEKIRSERKKARANRSKYSGHEGGGGLGPSSSGQYGGFGSESSGAGYGNYDGRVYGDGGGFGGDTGGGDFRDTQARRDNYEEYDEFDDGAASTGRKATQPPPKASSSRRETKKAEPPKPKEPEVDLFDFGDEPLAPPTSSKAPATTSSGLDILQSADDEDDFDDFQSAPVPAPAGSGFSMAPPSAPSTATMNTQFAAPQPVSATQNQSFNNIFSTVSPPPRTSTAASTTSSAILSPGLAPQSAGFQSAQPNYFTPVPSNLPSTQSRPSVATTPGGLGKPIASNKIGGAPKKAGGDAFAGLLGGMGAKKAEAPTGKVTMADMARQKASAGIWGAGTPSAASTPGAKPAQGQQKLGGGLDDLLG
ncbi:ENTH-domain-containing protein [Microthyrium microscopicum]|uniref:ENTH-domain-containing protein n=1 Tax=Microthyrium microscopicum TaxID=703497 RepID=A0A6A6UC13_9PEZI|nr:ENTH-domain-containing protein [Microthyrium microscopicum]